MPALTARPALALVAIIVVAILGGAFVLSRSDQSVGNPSTSPSPSPSASPYPSPLRLPSALVGGWLAPRRESPIAQGLASTIYFGSLDGNAGAPDFGIDGPGGTNAPATVEEIGPGVLELTATGALGGCTSRRRRPLPMVDIGRWHLADHGQDRRRVRGPIRPGPRRLGPLGFAPTTMADRSSPTRFEPVLLVHPAGGHVDRRRRQWGHHRRQRRRDLQGLAGPRRVHRLLR